MEITRTSARVYHIGDYFNDVTSSFIILEGHWTFFVDANFAGQMGPGGGKVLGPGVYNWIEDLDRRQWRTGASNQRQALIPQTRVVGVEITYRAPQSSAMHRTR